MVKFLAVSAFMLCLLIPLVSFGQSNGGLVPCGIDRDAQGTPGYGIVSGDEQCDFNDLLQLGINVIEILVILSIPATVLAFVYAGFLLLTSGGNAGQVSRAKDIFVKVLIGFVIILTAWLVVDLVVSVLFKGVDGTVFDFLA